jgi:hypothetical protein
MTKAYLRKDLENYCVTGYDLVNDEEVKIKQTEGIFESWQPELCDEWRVGCSLIDSATRRLYKLLIGILTKSQLTKLIAMKRASTRKTDNRNQYRQKMLKICPELINLNTGMKPKKLIICKPHKLTKPSSKTG